MMDESTASIAVGDDIKPYKIHVSKIASPAFLRVD
jgi:hypothetical protein